MDNPELGIANLLSKMVTDARFIIEKDYFYPGFDVIPVGPIPATPSELLMSDRLQQLIDKLKDIYDYIFIDSTPADIVADAAIVGKFADMSIFLLRENYTDRRKLPELENIFHSGSFNNMRIILNGSSTEVPDGKYNAYYNKKVKVIPMLPKLRSDSSYKNIGYLNEGTKKKWWVMVF